MQSEGSADAVRGGLGNADGPKKFGDVVTLDTLISRGEIAEGIKKEQDAVFMLARYSDAMCTIPVRDKSAQLAYDALHDFRGKSYLHRPYRRVKRA